MMVSRWLHKYVGLWVLLFLGWMSISGILLNHPEFLRNFSVPRLLVPGFYHPENWNRSALKGIVYVGEGDQSFYVYGRQGIFHTHDDGMHFQPFMEGDFPTPAWKKRTHHLYYNESRQLLLASTNAGVLRYNSVHLKWEQVLLPGSHDPALKIIEAGDHLFALTSSGIFRSGLSGELLFEDFTPVRTSKVKTLSMISVFLKLHDGSIWGLLGKLLWDAAGGVMLFLCISAFYIWFIPGRWKRAFKRKGRRVNKTDRRVHVLMHRYHKKLGWYLALLLVLIVFTGTFLRPPLMMTIARMKVQKRHFPIVENSNPWHDKIRNGFFDSLEQRLILDCKDGTWAGNVLEGNTFDKIRLPVRIFAMGATVFEEQAKGSWLVGSFGGLQQVDSVKKEAISLLDVPPTSNSGRPGRILVTGYIRKADHSEFVLDHYKGICDSSGHPDLEAIPMPEYIHKNYRMPLWNFLFELHNGRLFRGFMGNFYVLVILVGGLLSLLVLLTGVIDFLYIKHIQSRRI